MQFDLTENTYSVLYFRIELDDVKCGRVRITQSKLYCKLSNKLVKRPEKLYSFTIT